MPRKKREDFEHCFICELCATDKKLPWPKNHCATVHHDKCPYCNQYGMLSSISDWLKPSETRLKSWD